ncbi:hypothetical protein KUCAC02_035673, partial [Chaenocephalus aceratus]
VEAGLQKWFVTGLQQGGVVPSLMSPVSDSSSSLLTLEFEVNPESSKADQLLRVRSQSVKILYDALTVNSMVDFFKTGKAVDLELLTSATLSKLEEIKEKTATDLQPSFLLLPQSGFYCETSDILIVDFGSLQEIMDRAYEKYNLELRRVQVLYCRAGEDWESARLQASSQLHLLQPLDFSLQLAKSMVDRDARMPRFKVSGELPLLHLKISDRNIHGLLDLVDSIPLPNMGSPASTPTEKVHLVRSVPLEGPSYGRASVINLPPPLLYPMEADSDDSSGKSSDEDLQRSAQEEITELYFKFEVKEVLFEMLREQSTVLSLSVCELGAEGRRRSFDLSVTAFLRRVALDFCDLPDGREPLHLVRSSETQNSDLLKVDFIKADPAGPSFKSLFHSTEQNLKVENQNPVEPQVHVVLRVENQNPVEPQVHVVLKGPCGSEGTDGRYRCSNRSMWFYRVHVVLRVEVSSLDFLLHTKALLSTLSFLSSALPQRARAPRPDDQRPAGGTRSGLDASVSMQAGGQTEVFTRLRDIVVSDLKPGIVHRKVVPPPPSQETRSPSWGGRRCSASGLSLFPGATEGGGYSDMEKVDGKVTLRLGCIQIVYLHPVPHGPAG